MTGTLHNPESKPEETDAPEYSVTPSGKGSLGRNLLGATSALSAATGFERGLSFLASLFAARLGGASVFGAYSLAIQTANNISSYTGSGIGNTATRFAGEHGPDSPEYRTVVRAVSLVTCISAALASLLLLAGAAPLASVVLRNEALTGLLQWSSLSAAAVIVNESARGFFIGQRNHRAVILLSVLAGSGLVATLPALSRVSPSAMIIGQAAVALGAVFCCVIFARRLGLLPVGPAGHEGPLGPVIRRVWAFGIVQLASLVSMNAAGWWLTSQIARSDGSLVEVGLFAVSHQLRNMVALAPGLLAQSSYAMMSRMQARTGFSQDVVTTPEAIMGMSTFGATLLAAMLAGPAILVLPVLLPLVYSTAYSKALLPAVLALATAVVHMGSAPAAARLTLMSLRKTGAINMVWAVVVASAATVAIRPGGSATQAAGIYLAAHLISAVLVCGCLWSGELRRQVLPVFAAGFGGILLISALAFLRDSNPGSAFPLTILMTAVLLVTVLCLLAVGRLNHWLPRSLSLTDLFSRSGSNFR